MRDFNQDIRKIFMADWCKDLYLRDIMIDKLGSENIPLTYHRGSVPINVIMCSANIIVNKAAYLPFVDGASDHCLLMVDIDEMSIVGTSGVPSVDLRQDSQN